MTAYESDYGRYSFTPEASSALQRISKLISSEAGQKTYVKEYLRPEQGMRILDIGCGPAGILDYLPEVDYVGFDLSQSYIDSAKARFSQRGSFFCMNVAEARLDDQPPFDLVMANGVLHHLNDDEALSLLRLSRSLLSPEGRFVSIDNCWVDGQSRIARFLIARDRGSFQRTEQGYVKLARSVFDNVSSTVRHDLLRMPYTHCILECC
jgi:cyclopropane fatty-acyl-phospholipid synthase-like methyltransferase